MIARPMNSVARIIWFLRACVTIRAHTTLGGSV